jgi:hypothetical protein
MIKPSTIIICFFLLLVSCEKKTDWSLEQGMPNMIIVDGMITDELKIQSIRITKPAVAVNDLPEAVIGAEVIVTVNENVYHFHEQPGNPGTYQSDVAFKGVPGDEHSLLVTYENKVYSAKSGMVAWIGNFGAGIYAARKDNGMYKIVWLSRSYNPTHAVMYELLLDWSKVNGYENDDSVSTHARLLYYTLPTLDVSEVLSPAAETVRFPAGTLITERRFTLTTQHAAYIRALLSETTWQGGYFPTASANVPTNLSSGATGFFGACAVITRTDKIN